MDLIKWGSIQLEQISGLQGIPIYFIATCCYLLYENDTDLSCHPEFKTKTNNFHEKCLHFLSSFLTGAKPCFS